MDPTLHTDGMKTVRGHSFMSDRGLQFPRFSGPGGQWGLEKCQGRGHRVGHPTGHCLRPGGRRLGGQLKPKIRNSRSTLCSEAPPPLLKACCLSGMPCRPQAGSGQRRGLLLTLQMPPWELGDAEGVAWAAARPCTAICCLPLWQRPAQL